MKAGIVLYSVGPNRQDDGGEPIKRVGADRTLAGDLVWTISRPDPGTNPREGNARR